MTRAQVARLFDKLAAQYPSGPRSELRYRDPFQLLVAVILSAQATDKSVNGVTPALFAAAPTPQAMLALGESGLKRHIQTIGLFNSKAKHIRDTCRALIERHGGQVPRDREALEALPGVGRKTANVVLNVAFGEPTIAVDTHVFRVGNRTGLAPGKAPREVEEGLLKVVPKRHRLNAHHYLILHGRYICTARKPACGACPIARQCEWEEKPA